MTASDLKMNNSTKINTAVGGNTLTILRLSPADVSRVKIKDIPAHFSSNLQFRNLLNVTVTSATANFPSAAGVLCGSERRCSGMTCPPPRLTLLRMQMSRAGTGSSPSQVCEAFWEAALEVLGKSGVLNDDLLT